MTHKTDQNPLPTNHSNLARQTERVLDPLEFY